MINPIIDGAGDPNITGQGTFLLGSHAVFFFDFPDIDGNLFDPSSIDVTIFNPNNSDMGATVNIDRIQIGQYAFSWSIPNTAMTGKYSIQLEFVAETDSGPVDRTYSEDFVVGEQESQVIDQVLVGMTAFLETFLGPAQRIPIFDEVGKLNLNRDEVSFSFKRWNQTSGATILLNGQLTERPHTVDYVNGKVTFNQPLSEVDQVTARYTFRWFADNELYCFVDNAIAVFNQYPPQSSFGVGNLPDRYRVTAVLQAAVFALRRLMMDLMFQEPAKVFGGLERADSLIGSMDTLKKNYEDELKALYEAKLKQPYIGLTRSVTTPEFTLPGGRCLSYYSTITYRRCESKVSLFNRDISSTAVCSSLTGTIAEIFELCRKGEKLEVLSDNNGTLSFESISHIWETGSKPLLRITDSYDNYVEVSDEHIIFVNNKEIPARDVRVGDLLTVNLFHGVRSSEVVNIEKIDETPTFDLEVPSTENLFVNNIKCHNSRWFRYLFKGA